MEKQDKPKGYKHYKSSVKTQKELGYVIEDCFKEIQVAIEKFKQDEIGIFTLIDDIQSECNGLLDLYHIVDKPE